ncbi:hypothetical protein HMPREF1604_02921 [Escherichia coli 908519]|nr:hypothetical protein HMPREF1604_02921 [Escherichia coli 908519]
MQCFLSCLYGSEHKIPVQGGASCFLSCLYGSELENIRRIETAVFSKLPVRQ